MLMYFITFYDSTFLIQKCLKECKKKLSVGALDIT